MLREMYHALRERYAFKIGLAVLLVGALLLSVGYITFTETRASVGADAEATLTGIAGQEAADADEFIRDTKSQTLRISSETNIVTGNERTIWSKLETESSFLPNEVQAVKYLNLQTQTVEAGSNDLENEEFEVGERPWVMEMSDIGDPDSVQTFGPYEADGEKRLAFVSGVSGQPTHAIVTIVDLAARSQRLAGPTENTVVEVVSEDNEQIVLGSNPNSVLESSTFTPDLSGFGDESATNEIQTISTDNEQIDGGKAVVATAAMEEESWSVVVAQSQSTVFGTVTEVRRNVIVLIAIAVLGLLTVGAVIARDTNAALATMTEYAEEIEEGNLDVTIEQSRADEFGKLSGLFARIRDTLREQIEEAEQNATEADRARKEAETARAEAEEMAEYLQSKAEEYSEIMQQVGNGDLTQRMEADGQEDAMDQIAGEFNDMITELEKTTGQLQSYVDEVEEAGAEVERAAATITEASEQVAESIQLISDDAYEQNEQLQAIHETLGEVTETLERISAETDTDFAQPLAQIEETGEEVGALLETVEETMAESEQVAGAAEEQAAELNEVSDRAHDLQRYAEPLREILDRFNTEEEHEFVFTVGPTGGNQTPSRED